MKRCFDSVSSWLTEWAKGGVRSALWRVAKGVLILPIIMGQGLTGTASADTGGRWVGAWASAPSDLIAPLATETPPPFADMTLRNTLRLTLAGDAVRVRISNALGRTPLAIGAVSIRRRGATQFYPLLFGGRAAALVRRASPILASRVTAC